VNRKRGLTPFSRDLWGEPGLRAKKVSVPFFCLLLAISPLALPADEVGEALDASLGAQRAARESQQRVDKLDAETRALHQKRRAAEWQSLQLAAYAEQLEQEALVQEQKRKGIEAELARVATTGTDLQPLSERMLAELEAHVARDLPFLQEVRLKRIAEARLLLADPQRSSAEKFRRVLDAWRSEAEYGYSLGAEDVAIDCAGKPGTAVLLRVGRIGLYCLDERVAARWDAGSKRWEPVDDDEADEIAKGVAMAREKAPPELLVLPVMRK
jgi:hypothetical protein